MLKANSSYIFLQFPFGKLRVPEVSKIRKLLLKGGNWIGWQSLNPIGVENY